MKTNDMTQKVRELVKALNLRQEMPGNQLPVPAMPAGGPAPAADLASMLTNGDPPNLMLWGSEE